MPNKGTVAPTVRDGKAAPAATFELGAPAVRDGKTAPAASAELGAPAVRDDRSATTAPAEENTPPAEKGALTVRAATEADLPALLAIERAASHDPWGERAILSQLASSVGVSLVCEGGGRLLGSLYLSLMAPEGEVLALAVLPDARRRGIGRLLLENGEKALISGGACVLYLDVRASNAPARALYSALGFEEYGSRRGFYSQPREDAILMKKALAAPTP